MKLALLIATAVGEALLAGSFALSALRPAARVWPPPGMNPWRLWWIGTLSVLTLLGTLAVAVLDAGSFLYDHWSRHVVGGTLTLGGATLALWSMMLLGLRASSGRGGELVTGGPYRFSRNPQYLGTFGVLLGLAVLANSWRALVLGLGGCVAFGLAPLAEEPWLLERYGEPYRRYLDRVPRFLGRCGPAGEHEPDKRGRSSR